MKTLFLVLVTALFPMAALAQTTERVSLRPGQQRTSRVGHITVKFVRLVEDSRCPMNAKCVWAGNARVRIEVYKRGIGRRNFDLNTGSEPHAATYGGYVIRLEDITPTPPEPGRKPVRPTLEVSITRQ